jgi:hypothetical protein
MPTQEELDKTLKTVWGSMDGWDGASAVNLLCDVIVNMSLKFGLSRDAVVLAINSLIKNHPHWPENRKKDS